MPSKEAVEKIVRYFKHFFIESGIKDPFPDKKIGWSLDGKKWNEIDELEDWMFWKDFYAFLIRGHSVISESSILQTCLDMDIEPFFSFDYIYHAENFEDNMDRKWILGTIALEYAIKEFLMGRDPIFESFIFDKENSRRTPISVVYNRIHDNLESEGVSLCLKKDDFKIAAEIRNYLIHRPKKVENYLEIDQDEVRTYIQLAKLTIGQLFAHLNPNFPFYSDMMVMKSIEFPLKEFQDKMKKLQK